MRPRMTYPQVEHADLSNPFYVAWSQHLRMTEGRCSRDSDFANVLKIATWAYENAEGYRALYDEAGVKPGDLRDLDDLRRFPSVDKETIRSDLEAFSVPVEGRTITTTGGSTGKPLSFYRDPLSFARELASKAHQYRRVGWREGDRQLVLRGLVIDSPDHVEFVPEFNELRCSSYHLTPEWMEVYYEHALEYEPEWVRCYPSTGYIFARWLVATGREFPPMKGVLCASENIYDFQRRALSEAFGGRIFSHYGHYECAVLAGYCEHADTYHVLPQYGYAELLDGRGEPVTKRGQVGEIVATSFIMHATPFVRYRTEDLAVFRGWGCSQCGRQHQIWERIEGRLQEIAITKTGRPLCTSMLNMHDATYDHIRQFRFKQTKPGELILEYVPKSTWTQGMAGYVKASFARKLGHDMELKLREVDAIPPTGRGKHLLLVQELDIEYGDAALDDALRLM